MLNGEVFLYLSGLCQNCRTGIIKQKAKTIFSHFRFKWCDGTIIFHHGREAGGGRGERQGFSEKTFLDRRVLDQAKVEGRNSHFEKLVVETFLPINCKKIVPAIKKHSSMGT